LLLRMSCSPWVRRVSIFAIADLFKSAIFNSEVCDFAPSMKKC
jgi:hypothetical protein